MNSFSNLNDSPNIDNVAEISDADRECLHDLQQVLEKHGMENRFGVSLLHKHFDLDDGEVMLETQNVQDRTLKSRPVKLIDLGGVRFVATGWRFKDKKISVVAGCAGSTYGGLTGGHYGYKD